MLLVGAAGCAPAAAPVVITGERDGLVIDGSVTASDRSIAVDLVVRNERAEAVDLVPTQCGRVIDAELERTVFLPEGKRWEGSTQAVKELVLDDQRFLDRPDSFHPRRPGDASSTTPECVSPNGPIRLGPGAEIAERWELPIDAAPALDAVGSDATVITLEAVEARPNELEFLDFLPYEEEDEARRGRSVRAELPLSELLDREATKPAGGPTYGELFDRLMEDAELRAWIEAQPAESWSLATLRPAHPGYGGELESVLLRLVTKQYERAATIVAEPDGSNPTLDLPGEDARTRVFARSPGTLPPGIELVPDADNALSDDLHLGDVVLPSGRVLVGEYLFDAEPLDVAVAPGPYPVHATLTRYRDQAFDRVAFVSLALSNAPTVRWEEVEVIAVDGGSTTIVSVEGRDALDRLFADDQRAWEAHSEEVFHSIAAHDYLGTEFPITDEVNLIQVTSGVGDGGYPVYLGFDAGGAATRVVVDFGLLHLDWP